MGESDTTFDADALLEILPVGVVVHGADTTIRYANPKALELLRLTGDQSRGKDALDPHWNFVDTHHQKLPIDQYPVNMVLSSGLALTNCVIGIVDGTSAKTTWVSVNAYPQRDGAGRLEAIVCAFADISHEKKDIPFEEIVARASDTVVVTDGDPESPRIVFVNQAFTAVTGYMPGEVIGKSPNMLQGPDTDAATRSRVRAALAAGLPCRETILNYSKTGKKYWLDMNIVPLRNSFGEITYFAAVERDVSDIKAREQDLAELAIRDPLTGLLNRRGFSELADVILAKSRRDDLPLSFGMLDIDFFKRINDSYGHDVGDRALRHLADLMRARLRASDVVGRFGGEEFAILMTGTTLKASLLVLESFRKQLAAVPLRLEDGTALAMTVSIGVATLAPGDQAIGDLVRRSDVALYEAKTTGRDRICLPAA